MRARYAGDVYRYEVRDKVLEQPLTSVSLSGTKIRKVMLPRFNDWGDVLLWRARENVPGEFPFTAGVFPFKRQGEDPARMFAGEGGPERTNRRFHYVSRGMPAARLSTAFDSVTLYGEDPDRRPDIYGKVGNSGVSICTRRRREEALQRLRPRGPEDVGVDDDQRPGADAARRSS